MGNSVGFSEHGNPLASSARPKLRRFTPGPRSWGIVLLANYDAQRSQPAWRNGGQDR